MQKFKNAPTVKKNVDLPDDENIDEQLGTSTLNSHRSGKSRSAGRKKIAKSPG